MMERSFFMGIKTSLQSIGIRQALGYLERNPEENLPKLMAWVDRFAGDGPDSFPQQRAVIRKVVNDPTNNWYRFIINLVKNVDNEVLKTVFTNFIMNGNLIGWPRQQEIRQKYNCNVPWAILLDPTSACNLHCTGCWAAEYGNKLNLTFDEIDNIITQGKDLGVYIYIYTGGEPMGRKDDLIALCNKHTDCVFAAFTPPRFITGELCADLLRVRNLFPAIQVDEDGADATRATALLRRYKLPFGVACRCTAENAERVATELYYDRVIATGAKFCWFFTCPAYGPEQPASLEQLEAIHRRVQEFRRSKPLLTLDFWDGPSPSAAAPQGGTA